MYSQIEFLRTIMALPQNAPLIIGDMQETFTFRRQFTNGNRISATAILERYRISATAILERYPGLSDFNEGKLVRGSFFTKF